MATGEQALERRLEELLDVETFPVPEEFGTGALVTDRSLHEAAEADPPGWWAARARELLDWSREWDAVLDDASPPFYRWFVGGKLNACHNALDRHVEAGLGDRVAFHWRGEEGEERTLTYA